MFVGGLCWWDSVLLLTQFDLSILCQQNILTLDVSVDDLVLVKVGQALRKKNMVFLSSV